MNKKSVENAPLASLLQDKEILEGLQSCFTDLKNLLAEESEGREVAGVGISGKLEEQTEAFERLLDGRESTPNYFSSVEAIILTTGRPALLVQGGEWESPKLNAVRDRLLPAASHLKLAIPKVGRIELLNHPTYAYVGAGWMIDEDVMITNRHVANVFAFNYENRIIMRTDPFGSQLEVQTDFNEEYESPNPPHEVGLAEVLFIEKEGPNRPDMALIRLDGVHNLPQPIELSPLRVERGDDVAVIGYPAKDSGRNDPFVMNRIFKNIYDVKRLSPGRISGLREDRFIMTHDCTTLGGNSGSVVLNLNDGKAAGLHFAGSYQENNFAVTSETLHKKLAEFSARTLFLMPVSFPQEKVPSQSELEMREGYDPSFLAESVILPEVTEGLKDKLAPVNGRDDGLLHYLHFSIMMHKERRLSLYTACNIDGGKLFNIRRGRDRWNLDPRMDEEFQVGNELYKHNPLDRGHLVRRLDPAWGASRGEASQAADDTFFYTNAHPQHSQLNQKSWLGLEEYILDNAATHDLKISVFTGPIFNTCDQMYRGVQIPQEYWKVVVMMNTFTGRLSATGYLLSQARFIDDLEFVYGAYETYQVPIQSIGEKTGLDFGELVSCDPLGLVETIGTHIIYGSSDLIL